MPDAAEADVHGDLADRQIGAAQEALGLLKADGRQIFIRRQPDASAEELLQIEFIDGDLSGQHVQRDLFRIVTVDILSGCLHIGRKLTVAGAHVGIEDAAGHDPGQQRRGAHIICQRSVGIAVDIDQRFDAAADALVRARVHDRHTVVLLEKQVVVSPAFLAVEMYPDDEPAALAGVGAVVLLLHAVQPENVSAPHCIALSVVFQKPAAGDTVFDQKRRQPFTLGVVFFPAGKYAKLLNIGNGFFCGLCGRGREPYVIRLKIQFVAQLDLFHRNPPVCFHVYRNL